MFVIFSFCCLARLLLFGLSERFSEKILKGNKLMASVSTTSSTIQADYITLLVEQLKYQDPLNPLDNSEMASQLAQFSQLQQLETMNASFSDVLTTSKLMYASSLVGKTVSYLYEAEDGSSYVYSGTVQMAYKNDDEIFLAVDDYKVGIDNVLAISE